MSNRRVLFLLFSILTVAAILAVGSIAADTLDEQADVILNVDFHHQETAIAGAVFDLYRVASIPAYTEHHLDGDFGAFSADLKNTGADQWDALAGTLSSYALANAYLPIASSATNEQGIVTFNGLGQGLYLGVGHTTEIDQVKYSARPFLVLLPSQDPVTQDWVYNVTVHPKSESEQPSKEPVTRRVMKIWLDEGHEKDRPEIITVSLLQNGQLFDTVTLSESNGWEHTWMDLDGSAEWTVMEDPVDPYMVTIESNGITFVITNKHPEYQKNPPETDPPDTNPPDTNPPDTQNPPTTTAPVTSETTYDFGDDTVPRDSLVTEDTIDTYEFDPNTPPKGKQDIPQTGLLWWPVPILCGLGLAFILTGFFVRKRERNE